MRKLYLKSGELFSNNYERVVHGGRGDYIELTKDQIICKLKSKFNQPLERDINSFYYYWLTPENDTGEKIYLQLKTVSYADYKVGYYYISPDLIKGFEEDEVQLTLF